MKPNQYLFDKIKDLMKNVFKEDLIEYEDGNSITLKDTGFWVSVDQKELTIGLEFNHIHYNFDYDSMEDAIDTFFLTLTKRKKITNYSKGSQVFKTKVVIELDNNEILDLGLTSTIPLQFWKKTKSETSYSDEFVNENLVTAEWKELINYAQQRV